MPAAAGLGGVAAGAAVGAGYPPGSEPVAPPVPWYRQRGPLTAAIIGGVLFLAVLGFLLYWFFVRDDDGSSTVNRLILETTDELGEPLERAFTADVSGPADFPDSFLWLLPPNSRAPEPAESTTTSGGKVEFQWGPTEEVGDMTLWPSSITLTEAIPADWTPPGPIIPCSLERRDVDDSIVELAVTVEPADPTLERIATYEFVSHVFQPGDTVKCGLTSAAPGATTTTTSSTSTTSTTSTTTTTVPETTTTETTVPETDPPVTEPPVTEPPVTEPPVTEPPVTEPPVTEPPVEDVTVWSVLESRDDMTTIRDLIVLANLQSGFEDPGASIGFFAPDDDAFDGVTLPTTEDDARELVQTHMNDTGAISSADFVTGDLAVVFGGPHAMDTGVDPPTLGGFQIIEVDVPAAPGATGAAVNGVFHVLAGVLTP